MSDDNKNAESFDFDFNDLLNEGKPQKPSGDSSFDLDNPFGEDMAFGNDMAPLSSETEVNADFPNFDDAPSFSNDFSADSATDSFAEESSVEDSSEISEGEVPPIAVGDEKAGKKKKGFLGGLFGGKKEKTPKEKVTKEKNVKEKQPKPKKEKKEKVVKDKDAPAKPAVPRDWGTILCVLFSLFLLVSLLTFNAATFLSRDASSTLMGTLCFLGAFNLVGLTLVAVPILFYKFPKERTLPNVLLGISVGAMFTGVLFLVNNFYYYYGFTVSP